MCNGPSLPQINIVINGSHATSQLTKSHDFTFNVPIIIKQNIVFLFREHFC